MKKLFTLALVLLVAIGYSQVSSAGELDYTTYDWQTNAGPRNWTIVWPDGKINFAYIIASDETFSDRGTGIGTYDSELDEWIPLGGRIENEKTCYGSIARYRDNSIVLAAHTTTQCGIYIIENKDNMTPNSVPAVSYLDGTHNPICPVVMTSGSNRDIIHIIATGYSDNNLYYFRSRDGGYSWDKENIILPFLTEEYGSHWGYNVAYWMETTEDNCLALVVNNAWSDGMVIYSYDDGETWERKVFYHHPGINTTFNSWFMYPRWASCVWGIDNELCVAYEFNTSTGEPGSGNYDPAVGGVAFWSENMPYIGYYPNPDPTNPMPPVHGQPFIMDSPYIDQDIWATSPFFPSPTHEMWPEYMGYLSGDFSIGELGMHGNYNCGCVAMPVLCKVPDSDNLVAVWIAMDKNYTDSNGNFLFKLFASYSFNNGQTWTPQIQLTNDFMWALSEFVYPQVALVGTTLVVAVLCDDQAGTYVHGDEEDPSDSYYQGFTFMLTLPVGVPEVSHNTHMTLYPNPAVDQLNVTLSQNADIVIYNIMGQKVMSVEGHVGANTLNISSLSAGVYFVNAGSDTQKFVVK